MLAEWIDWMCFWFKQMNENLCIVQINWIKVQRNNFVHFMQPIFKKNHSIREYHLCACVIYFSYFVYNNDVKGVQQPPQNISNFTFTNLCSFLIGKQRKKIKISMLQILHVGPIFPHFFSLKQKFKIVDQKSIQQKKGTARRKPTNHKQTNEKCALGNPESTSQKLCSNKVWHPVWVRTPTTL